ncbi:MAG: hypothetical protein JOZ22_11445 [Acidobacteriia bacterium]|nr:hypothetical protein [Terriglobia bacterium]MBV9743421.1 hypothetical protein [Terriglobia bacterium]
MPQLVGLGLKAFQFVVGFGEIALEAVLFLPDLFQRRELLKHGIGCAADEKLEGIGAAQFPGRGDHLFEVQLLSTGVTRPLILEIFAELVVLFEVFAGEEDGFGTETMP